MESVVALLFLCIYGTYCTALSIYCPAEYLKQHVRPKCCSRCPPGTFMKQACTATLPLICEDCHNSLYISEWNNRQRCLRCDECNHEGMKYKRNCSSSLNTQCDCTEGYQCDDNNCRMCIRKEEKEKICSCPLWRLKLGTCLLERFLDISLSGNYLLGHLLFIHFLFVKSCTGADHTPTNRPSAGMDQSAKATSSQSWGTVGDTIRIGQMEIAFISGAVTITMVLIILLLLCLLVGMRVISWRKKTIKLLPAEMRPWYLRVQMEDTYSIHLPEQECGGLSQQERKITEPNCVSLNCTC
ncbi:uncharacterized protein LOC144510242 [Mustelus asterias]